ncbi:unnamed protein product [Prorocentrum cordatum]|uniref:Uncharacterized protein n=1 Tax=Prorocentrum cordatum TaxID=2364126 RepID=A0ABN9QLR8_9DINO|nr:unnamed protein product [Polarella glacialis]
MQLAFCSAHCLESTADVPGLSQIDPGMLALFRASWLGRDRRRRARLLLDPSLAADATPPASGSEPVPLKSGIATVMTSAFFCETSREFDKVTQEIRRVISAAKSWGEYRLASGMSASRPFPSNARLGMPAPRSSARATNRRLKCDRCCTIDAGALDGLLEKTSLGDGILPGESKKELRMRIVAVWDLLHSLPTGFLDGPHEDLAQSARVLLKTSKKNASGPVLFSMSEAAAREWPKMTTTDRLWHFFRSVGGTSHFHAWQMCSDCPAEISESSEMRAVGPRCYSYLRLAYTAVDFPATWNSAAGRALGIRLVEHLRTRPELQGLQFPGPTLSFNDSERKMCESVKTLKTLHNDDLLVRVGELGHALPSGALLVPASGQFRTRRFRVGLAALGP